MANYSLDVTLIAIFAFVQWRITLIVLAAAPYRWVRCAIYFFDAFAAVTYTFTFAEVLAALPIPAHIGMVLGAGALAYLRPPLECSPSTGAGFRTQANSRHVAIAGCSTRPVAPAPRLCRDGLWGVHSAHQFPGRESIFVWPACRKISRIAFAAERHPERLPERVVRVIDACWSFARSSR